MLRWQNIKDILIFLPAFHFILCFLHLFFYDAVFSGGIQNFSSPSDIFTVSFTALAPAYFVTVVFSPIVLFYDARTRRATHPKLFDKPSRRIVPKSISLAFAFLGVVTIAVALCFAIALKIKFGFWPMMMVGSFMGGIIFVAVGVSMQFVSEHKPVRIAAFLMAMIVGSLASGAMGEAQRDRHFEYASLQRNRASCAKLAILKPLGTNFLAVASDQSRLVIDNECKPLFVLHSSRDFVPLPNMRVYRPIP